jgi:Cu/Ag efflux protein CusF
MKNVRFLPLLFVPLLAGCSPAACDCDSPTPVAAAPAAPAMHPLCGVVVGLLPDKTALLVKHEEIPGVMRAMTMMFKVEPAVLEQVKQGDGIKALMSRRPDGWWLTQVEVTESTKD